MGCVCGSGQETTLRCSKCDRPICSKCMVQTPVGARCPECARLYKLPTYSVSSGYYLRAVVISLVLAVAIGFVWGLAAKKVPLFDLNLLLGPALGYIVGLLTSLVVNRKRSVWLAVIGASGVVVGYAVNILPRLDIFIADLHLQFILFNLLALAIGIYFAVNHLR